MSPPTGGPKTSLPRTSTVNLPDGEFREQYLSKLTTPRELVAQFQPGNVIHFGVWYFQPYGVMKALGEFGQGIDPLYVSNAIATAPFELFNLPGVRCSTAFYGSVERASQKANNNVFYTPTQFTDGQRLIRESVPFDYFIIRTTPMNERGRFNCSLTSSFEYRGLKWLRENRRETKVVIEVNPNLPVVYGLPEFGDNELTIDDADIIVEDDSPLMEFPTPPPNPIEKAIAENVALLVKDRDTIQLGFGAIPMAIGRLLATRRELGVHTEMLCEAHVDLIEAGAVSNSHKGLHDGYSVCTFALGMKRVHEFCRENKAVRLLPVDETNSVPVLARVKNMVSINSALTTDLTGQTCAHTLFQNTYSGMGGAFEFTYGSQLSPSGRSIMCMPSSTKLKDGGMVSNILSRYPAGTRVTIPEHSVDWIATEYGAVRLKFLNLEQRAIALIRIAHPQFREQLTREAVDSGLRLKQVEKFPLPQQHFVSSGVMS